ncbi:MAG: type IV pilus modification protein PilV [Bacillota bacterium]
MRPRAQRGFTMIEILVSMTIVAIGLLGLVALQTTAQQAELESYSRAQALALMQDMVERINANRYSASCFAFTTDTTNGVPYLGTVDPSNPSNNFTPTCTVGNNTASAVDAMTNWDSELNGTAERNSANTKIGAAVGARGCVSSAADPTTGITTYTIMVAWQGTNDGFAPSKACGNNLYGAETKRRLVWTTLQIANLN